MLSGQVIVGLQHRNIGHPGIFGLAKVAKKEHAQIVGVLESVEMLSPGLYGMHICEHSSPSGEITYEVEFKEHRLEDLINRINRINRFERADEKPLEAVAQLSKFTQNAYEMFLRPMMPAVPIESGARALSELHPLRAGLHSRRTRITTRIGSCSSQKCRQKVGETGNGNSH